jgi:hypothetical protein
MTGKGAKPPTLWSLGTPIGTVTLNPERDSIVAFSPLQQNG